MLWNLIRSGRKQSPVARRRPLAIAALLLGCGWLGLGPGQPGRALAQVPFALTNLQVAADGRVALQAPARPGFYTVLRRGGGTRSGGGRHDHAG
jgi:hypothetical protein